MRSGAQVLDRFGGVCERVFDRVPVRQGLDTQQLALTHGTADIAPQQRSQFLEFKGACGELR
jgi:hypothetical protein